MFNENLKSVMEQRGISQAELSKLTGIGKPSISQYLSGKNEPSPKNVKTIADALDCPVDRLITVIQKVIPPQAVDKTKLTIAEAAQRCGKSKEFISGWLQDGDCPFGYARKGTGEKWDYFIVAARLESYLSGFGM